MFVEIFSLAVTATTSERPLLVHVVILKQCSQLFEVCEDFLILKNPPRYFFSYHKVFCLLEVKSPSNSHAIAHTKCTLPETLFFPTAAALQLK